MFAAGIVKLLVRVSLALAFLPTLPCAAQGSAGAPTLAIDGLGKGSAPLDGPWQFHLGDDRTWAQPGIDDATGHNGWEQLTADKPWGLQGHANYAGFGWYRKHITLSTVPGAPSNIALLIPGIDDAYELYWNGVPVGGMGSLPPHRIDVKLFQPQQTYGLGPVRSGVLAVRVLKLPLSSVDDGTAGGFEATPHIGSPDAITLFKTGNDYRWLQRRQAQFGLTTLYALTSLLSFFAWLRDRRQKLLFWVAAFTFIPILELIFNGIRLPISGLWDTFFVQTVIQLREVCQWYLLIYLLQLEGSPRLMRGLRVLAWTALLGGAIDGALSFNYGVLNVTQFTWLDASLTAVILLVEPVPVVLVLMALFRRQRLDHARWLVAFFAFAAGIWYTVSNISLQGIRFTHWTLPTKMNDVAFTLFGSSFPMIGIFRTLLFLAILYAVLRFAVEYRHRQAAIEQEMQAARELQQVLVPETLPEIAGYRITSAYKPAQEVGGDFYQIIPLEAGWGGVEIPSGATLIVLGDVSGKGLKAAMTVSLIVGAIRTIAETTSAPAEILACLNRRLNGRLHGGFATCIVLRLDADGRCAAATAGHPGPFLNRCEVDLPSALPLGIVPDAQYEERVLSLEPGDYLALYTDGLLEARAAGGEIFSFERLEELFATRPDAMQASDAAVSFGQEDDITVLTLSRSAVADPLCPAVGVFTAS
jgi:hypothetical protein